MGASGWHYLVPYRDDVAQALEELRHTVYKSAISIEKDPDPAHALTEEISSRSSTQHATTLASTNSSSTSGAKPSNAPVQ
jgi:hypothetical protein